MYNMYFDILSINLYCNQDWLSLFAVTAYNTEILTNWFYPQAQTRQVTCRIQPLWLTYNEGTWTLCPEFFLWTEVILVPLLYCLAYNQWLEPWWHFIKYTPDCLCHRKGVKMNKVIRVLPIYGSHTLATLRSENDHNVLVQSSSYKRKWYSCYSESSL